jgi:hypothetical protein
VLKGKTEELRKKPVAVLLFPTYISPDCCKIPNWDSKFWTTFFRYRANMVLA